MASDFKRDAKEDTRFAVSSIIFKQEPVDWHEEPPFSPEHHWIKSESVDSVHCSEATVQNDPDEQLLSKSTFHVKPIAKAKAETGTSEKLIIRPEKPQSEDEETSVGDTWINKLKTRSLSLKPSEDVTHLNIKMEVKSDIPNVKTKMATMNSKLVEKIVQTVTVDISINRVDNNCPVCLKTFPKKLCKTCSAYLPKESLIKSETVDSDRSAETAVQSTCASKSAFQAKWQTIDEARTGNDSSKVPCPICSKLYLSNKLQSHLRRTHPPESCTVSCPLCERQFKSQQFLAYHLKVLHQPNNASYFCIICSKRYTSLHNYRVHMKTVHPPKTLQVQCKLCSKYFKSKQYLRLHTRSVHADKNEHTNCAKCSKRFKSRSHLAQHMKNVHRQFRCCVCRVEFQNRQELEDHAAVEHLKNHSIVICDNCSHTYQSKVKLVQHLRLNQCRGVRCKCHVCGRELRSKICLRRHVLAVHKLSPNTKSSDSGGQKLVCRLCEFGCTFKLELKRHMDEMHGDLHSAEDLNDIPLGMHEIIHLPVDAFNERMTELNLSEGQLSLVRDIRRRGKNKLAARKCRRRKLEKITSLSDEVQMVRDRTERFRREQQSLIAERQRVRDGFSALYRYASQNLCDEDGSPITSEQFLLQQAAEGSFVLVPQNSLDRQQSGDGLMELDGEKLTDQELVSKKENYEE